MSEIEWRAIPGWEGYYDASSDGQVRNARRIIRQTARGNAGYLHVSLRRDGDRVRELMTVHKAVMLTFAGPRPAGHDIRHLDGNPRNNTRANLAYGTRSENNLDSVRHGTNLNAAKTHCKRGHEFNSENTYVKADGGRQCRSCRPIHERDYYARKVAA